MSNIMIFFKDTKEIQLIHLINKMYTLINKSVVLKSSLNRILQIIKSTLNLSETMNPVLFSCTYQQPVTQGLPVTSFQKLNTYRYLKTNSVVCITVLLSYPSYFRSLLVRVVRGSLALAFQELVRYADFQGLPQNPHFNRIPR